MNDDNDLDRIRGALSSTDGELDANRLRTDLLLAQAAGTELRVPAGRAWRRTAQVLVAAMALAVVVTGAAVARDALDRVEPVSAVPEASSTLAARTPPPVKQAPFVGNPAGSALLTKVVVVLDQTRLTAEISARRTPSGAPYATVTHAPGFRLISAHTGDRTYLSFGAGDAPRQQLVDDSRRHVWTADPRDQTLAASIDLPLIDPVIALTAADRAHAPAVRSHTARPDQTLLQIYHGGSRLDCTIDNETLLPIACRTSSSDPTGSTTTTTTLSWQVQTLDELRTRLAVDPHNGYTWSKVVPR